MAISISELYGKKLLTSEGRELGVVKSVILDVEEGTVSHLVLIGFDELKKTPDIRDALKKKSVMFKRVRSIGETVVVSSRED